MNQSIMIMTATLAVALLLFALYHVLVMAVVVGLLSSIYLVARRSQAKIETPKLPALRGLASWREDMVIIRWLWDAREKLIRATPGAV